MTDAKSDKGKADTSASGSNDTSKRSMVELKNGKVLLRQKPMSFSQMTETMQETVKLREWLEERIEKQDPPLAAIPLEHRPLIAKLVQESDKTISAISKQIQQLLVPAEEDDEENTPDRVNHVLPLAAVEEAVLAVARRVNYGVDVVNSVKIPASLCVWRWEVKPEHSDWLPKASREKIDARLADRVQAKKDVQMLFDALPQSEQDTLLGVKATAKPKTQPPLRATSNDATSTIDVSSPLKIKERKVDASEPENDNASRGPGRPKKDVDPEKAAKEKERLEKKTAKAEKEKKEKEAQTKARSMMANFFGKPKASTSTSASPVTMTSAASTSQTTSDFQKAFKSFVVKKDAEMASVNWFRSSRRRRRRRQRLQNSDVIVVDADEDVNQPSSDVEIVDAGFNPNLSPKSHIRSIIAAAPPSLPSLTPRRSPPSKSKGKGSHLESVRALMTRLSEAELSDDTSAVRAILSQLRDRAAIPAKIFIFEEDARPGYFGTFTRSSRFIGARKPFGRDVVALDYAYDSGEDWEGEEEGGGDDVAAMSDDDKEDDGDSSDMEGWLVDGDEEEVATPIDEREGLDAFPFPPIPNKGKRKAEGEILAKEAEKGDGAKAKKRKVVVPLVPFIKGPCWETEIGRCDYDPFKQYRIQLFNDSPYPLDPFTFVSTSTADIPRSLPDTAASSSSTSSKSTPQFAIPALPPHLLNSSNSFGSPASSSVPPPKKPRQVLLKHPFPEAHVPYLLKKVAVMGASSLTLLVEAIYQDLKTHKVKKNAVEAKIRETCVKDQSHRWVVKRDIDKIGKTTNVVA